MENKQTAVDFFLNKIALKLSVEQIVEFLVVFEQAKQMEEDKIREAYYRGVKDEMQNIGKDFEDYYNETYGKENSN